MPGTANSGGRNRKSAQMHLVQGTFRKHRHAEQGASPEPPPGRPPVPDSLKSSVARAEWDRMVARLETSGTLSVVDDAALYQYVQLFAETESVTSDDAENRALARRLMRAVGKLNGSDLLEAVKAIVALRQLTDKATIRLRQQRMAIRQYLVEFGMTTVARSRVKVTDAGKPQSKLDAFMARARTGSAV